MAMATVKADEAGVALTVCRCGVEGCSEPHPDTAPARPTDGWCYSELERLGHGCRGRMAPREVAAALKVHGYLLGAKAGARARRGDTDR